MSAALVLFSPAPANTSRAAIASCCLGSLNPHRLKWVPSARPDTLCVSDAKIAPFATSYDQTVYNAHAPSAYLDWLIFVERQRMRHVLFDAESVEVERTSVISELRRYENSPSYTMAEHRLRRAALVAHPYGPPIMGWASDLQSVTPAELERFYREYYAANNLILAIAPPEGNELSIPPRRPERDCCFR